MMRSILILTSVLILGASGLAAADEPVETQATPAALLLDALAQQGLTEDASTPAPWSPDLKQGLNSFSGRAPVCLRQCEIKFVDGYESCAALFEKLAAKSPQTTQTPRSEMCGRAALSGLNVCRSDCEQLNQPEAQARD
ncbi:hypothetical protein ACFFUB_01580 [Algimonas porphyrae]|uniref:Secreted protein n=1 Tax=Algimonas porphyrae TaxID=1128113 RepID=A0ABQ5V209_9PROT|nr:hypothetical protein [Algimonas porphyrae]GLQ20729.1 hypothetical protein GCM10007854_16840 [Algimonas porphyrae]